MANFTEMNPVTQALLATLFTYFVTAAGAALVLFMKNTLSGFLDAMLGLAGGIMIAASFYSLLLPAQALAEELDMISWMVIPSCVALGAFVLYLGDKFFCAANRLLSKNTSGKYNKRSIMLMLSITLHNIPEGLAIGVAFGSIASGGSSLSSAAMLAVGIGLQNFPEGMAVSAPLRKDGASRAKAFFFGQLSALVEPIAGVVGALLALSIKAVLPYFLSFAAGAMIYVVVAELIPESNMNEKKELVALFSLLGFCIMSALDMAFA